jgi:hypothetical protein
MPRDGRIQKSTINTTKIVDSSPLSIYENSIIFPAMHIPPIGIKVFYY